MKKIIAKYVLGYPKTVIICSLIITILLGMGIPKIQVEDDVKEMLPKDLPARLALNEMDENFGGTDVFLVAINNDEQTKIGRASCRERV